MIRGQPLFFLVRFIRGYLLRFFQRFSFLKMACFFYSRVVSFFVGLNIAGFKERTGMPIGPLCLAVLPGTEQ